MAGDAVATFRVRCLSHVKSHRPHHRPTKCYQPQVLAAGSFPCFPRGCVPTSGKGAVGESLSPARYTPRPPPRQSKTRLLGAVEPGRATPACWGIGSWGPSPGACPTLPPSAPVGLMRNPGISYSRAPSSPWKVSEWKEGGFPARGRGVDPGPRARGPGRAPPLPPPQEPAPALRAPRSGSLIRNLGAGPGLALQRTLSVGACCCLRSSPPRSSAQAGQTPGRGHFSWAQLEVSVGVLTWGAKSRR